MGADYFSGKTIYGDDLDADGIREWYDAEANGYFELANHGDGYTYSYHELNLQHAYSALRGRRFRHCLGVGCSNGAELEPIANQVERFTAIEPARKWWADKIGGRPATYVAPSPDHLPVETASVDLITCFGVLHHIPNASHTIGEFARVLEPGGILLLREPIHTMGDWRKPRRGLTANERGYPVNWLRSCLEAANFRIDRERYCGFPATSRIAAIIGRPAYNDPLLTRLDRIVSLMTSWNLHYHRDQAWKKVAPAMVQFVATRRDAPS